MVKAGEVAPSHRHTPNALRLIVDSDVGAFTVVDGARVPMEPGDVVLTPSWHWHGHVNESPRDAMWIDFLDVPTVQFLEPMFLENHPNTIEDVKRDAGAGMRIAGSEIEYLLDGLSSNHGYRSAPLKTPHLKTMGLQVARLDAGAEVQLPRTTANAIYAVMSGQGGAVVELSNFDLARGDVLAVPTWNALSFAASEKLNLLRVSDEPMLKTLGWLRQDDSDAASHGKR